MGPFTYQWSPNEQWQYCNKHYSRTYTVTVSPSNGACSALATVTVTEPPGCLLQNQNIISAVCGASNGSIATTISVGLHLININGRLQVAFGANASNFLAPGNYTLTVIDNNNCDFIQAFIVLTITTSTHLSIPSKCELQRTALMVEITLTVNGVSANCYLPMVQTVQQQRFVEYTCRCYTVTDTDGELSNHIIQPHNYRVTLPQCQKPVGYSYYLWLNNGAITKCFRGTGAFSYQWAPFRHWCVVTEFTFRNLYNNNYWCPLITAKERDCSKAASTSLRCLCKLY